MSKEDGRTNLERRNSRDRKLWRVVGAKAKSSLHQVPESDQEEEEEVGKERQGPNRINSNGSRSSPGLPQAQGHKNKSSLAQIRAAASDVEHYAFECAVDEALETVIAGWGGGGTGPRTCGGAPADV